MSEYLNIITDPVGNIRKPLFYDNVRDFQGDNPVNSEIKSTLEDSAGRQRFAVLNNGVTVVTCGLRTIGNKFIITDYQIVNGCQTSHVLFAARDKIADDTYVPVKVISTSDEDIITAIITATSRQTLVTPEDLYAPAFQKKLEALFESYPVKKKLHYERRSKQYAAVNGIEKVRIIGKTQQVRAFAAMFLDDPHRATRYYSDLRSQVGTKIFNDNHKLEPYYVAAYGFYKLDYLFRNNLLPAYYKPARYHLLMALRYIVSSDRQMPVLTTNKVTTYANNIAEVLWSDDKSVSAFKQAIEAVDTVFSGTPLNRDVVKTQGFTDSIKQAVKQLTTTSVDP